jgi:HD-GYP domain-containing protein (c-di-GMP phosphodiesterase class II)
VPADVPSSVTRTLNSWRRRPADSGVGRPRFFHVVERLTQLLEEVVADILNGRSRGVPDRLIQLAVQIQLQAARDPDGFLASLELFDGGRYGSIHALHSATFCELVAQGHVRDNALRAKLVAAALTRDIGFLELQDELDQQSEPLTSEQQLEVREHPLSSVRLLRDAGVDDTAWLDAVGQHHERLNGGGYPASLVGDRIGGWARILGIVDIYSALTKTRAYRPAIQGPHAVRALLESRGSSVDPALAQELIRILGLWPPGLLVRLVSGETAVVVRRTANLKAPEIRVIADSDGRQLLIYQFRDASEADSLIQEVLPRSSTFRERINHRQLWGDIVFVTRR